MAKSMTSLMKAFEDGFQAMEKAKSKKDKLDQDEVNNSTAGATSHAQKSSSTKTDKHAIKKAVKAAEKEHFKMAVDAPEADAPEPKKEEKSVVAQQEEAVEESSPEAVQLDQAEKNRQTKMAKVNSGMTNLANSLDKLKMSFTEDEQAEAAPADAAPTQNTTVSAEVKSLSSAKKIVPTAKMVKPISAVQKSPVAKKLTKSIQK